MINEADISAERRWYFEKLAERAIQALKRNNFDAMYVPGREEALAKVLELIPDGGTIGFADSVTLHEIGFIRWAKEQKAHKIFSPFLVERSDFSDENSHKIARFDVGRKALTADVFVTGTNAVTINGQLVNIDGHGNRVAAMIYGPNRVIVVAGVNKIVRDVDEAIKRIHEYVAPINQKRHLEKHGLTFMSKLPCVITGECSYCQSENKGCRITVIIDGWSPIVKAPSHRAPFIIMVGEFLGI